MSDKLHSVAIKYFRDKIQIYADGRNLDLTKDTDVNQCLRYLSDLIILWMSQHKSADKCVEMARFSIPHLIELYNQHIVDSFPGSIQANISHWIGRQPSNEIIPAKVIQTSNVSLSYIIMSVQNNGSFKRRKPKPYDPKISEQYSFYGKAKAKQERENFLKKKQKDNYKRYEEYIFKLHEIRQKAETEFNEYVAKHSGNEELIVQAKEAHTTRIRLVDEKAEKCQCDFMKVQERIKAALSSSKNIPFIRPIVQQSVNKQQQMRTELVQKKRKKATKKKLAVTNADTQSGLDALISATKKSAVSTEETSDGLSALLSAIELLR